MRRFLKQSILLFNALLRRDTSPKVVYYHDIGTKYTPMGTPEFLFGSHMAYLKREVEKIGGGGQRSAPFHEVAFDDGFRGIWDHREILRQYDIHSVVFLAVALVGKPSYLTWDEIRTLQNDYGVNFQCHTWSHQTLIGSVNTDLPIPADPNFRTDAWYHHELVDSKAELEHQLNLSSSLTTNHQPPTTNHEVTSLCFPVGYFSDDVIKRCAAAGYTKLYASFPGNKEDNSIVELPLPTPTHSACRVIPRCLCQSSSLTEFEAILAGGLNPLRNRYFRMHYVEAAE